MVSATAEAAKLKTIMGKHGVTASIELQVGRPWAGDAWYSAKAVLVNHHTAGSATGLTPSLALVKRGRGAALPGPLCNGYGGRDHIYRIITMGLANHPGAGGPLTVAGFRIPKDSARISTWGTEWEHDGVSAWPDDMKEFMGRSNAALCEFWGISAARSIEHKTWAPNRKIDRNLYTAAVGQAEIRRWQTAGTSTTAPTTTPKPQQEDDVSFTDKHKLTDADVRAYGTADNKAGDLKSYDEIVRFPPSVARLRREMTARFAALTAAVVALGQNGGLTGAEITQAAEAGATAALAKLGDALDAGQ